MDGEPAAQIIHTRQVKFVFQGLWVEATGQGGSAYLPNVGKFVSYTVLPDCAVPRQHGRSGGTFRAKGTQKVSHRLRYFGPGATRPSSRRRPRARRCPLPRGPWRNGSLL